MGLDQGAFGQPLAPIEGERSHRRHHDLLRAFSSRLRSEDTPALPAVRAAAPPAIKPALTSRAFDQPDVSLPIELSSTSTRLSRPPFLSNNLMFVHPLLARG